jgi:hypothetical protein
LTPFSQKLAKIGAFCSCFDTFLALFERFLPSSPALLKLRGGERSADGAQEKNR